ncbi:hypothetical protein P168DRAFT_321277 [Aspergillus campestris IBT 28561]|uniref:Uncharacterized protein n=1 Tax=Aspergillus campestris (strain IBT 28561) TaxID=1392248 RepID=A0A2I1CVP0_ASPC2|nr:uncharacterized protein P168DRAFT_321277 [Aspergillus campestris IBT 28561]PKY01697.1 hypothetical protein P168DRAFT_321277 [Aspergillus campestris IBT 28561]
MAQAFSTALDSAFSLDSDVTELSQSVDNKRYKMMIQNKELEELQTRIREAEERLKSRQSVALPGSGSRNPPPQTGDYQQSASSTSATTSPTDTAGQYSSGDEQRYQHAPRHS